MIKKLIVSIAAFVHIFFVTRAIEATSTIKHVFVIAMENTDAKQIYGNLKRAPYINKFIA